MRSAITFLAIGYCLLLGSCTNQGRGHKIIREAQLDRSSLQETIFENPYGPHVAAPGVVDPGVGRTPSGQAVNWIESSDETGPTTHTPFYNKPEDVQRDEQARRAGLCSSVEYPGKGKFAPGDRGVLSRALTGAKEDLIAWVERHRIKFPTSTYETLMGQIRSLRLGEPSVAEDPDLAVRGIGVWTRDSKGPVVRLGPGFLILMKKDPERARFELIRLAAQGWAPCELTRLGAPGPWSAYLRCMGIQESEKGCGIGDYSEAGWAVSSAVASVLVKPGRLGCTLPAFSDSSHAECPRNFLLPLSLSSGEKIPHRELTSQ
jgi:hypothetical protein